MMQQRPAVRGGEPWEKGEPMSIIPLDRNENMNHQSCQSLEDAVTEPVEMVVFYGEEENDQIPISYRDHAILVPTVGQTFEDESDGYAFYNLYARFYGFGTRRSKCRYKEGGMKSMQEFCCIRQGRDKFLIGNPTRIGCRAMLRINRSSENQNWRVSAFTSEHNHVMKRDLRHTQQFRSHNFIAEGTKRSIEEMVDSGMAPTAMYGLVSAMHGGPSLTPFTKRSMTRMAYAIRRDESSKDVQKTLNHFREMQCRSKNFFYNIQTSIFGCALLREETVEAFKWLFQTFTEAMHGNTPSAILTDNCHQMEIAIREVWLKSIHRVCKWHVLKNAKENLGNIYSKRNKFKEEFHKVLNEPQSIEEFLRAWSDLVQKYNLESSVYLRRMWDMKERWAPAYFRGHFFARMSTTQRSESMNHVLKKYIKPSSSL
ncbi:protein FAR1-RELATED SEQUENCE 5-like [Oryza brachyantha]|uniref:protein FAR1-RELATED SEQUENCE 5-like n=1 Tax=Oryza brachyantha TaxID=4533 RepID=UPI001AD9CE1F|nr:protein FAR1-RELATED SEQUENCE 5-like [Oryza brachyantha]